jgi:hypothetical protein
MRGFVIAMLFLMLRLQVVEFEKYKSAASASYTLCTQMEIICSPQHLAINQLEFGISQSLILRLSPLYEDTSAA